MESKESHFAGERSADFDAKREAYEVVRAERDWIIDHPDKSIPLGKYKAKIRDAQDKCRQAHRDMLDAL